MRLVKRALADGVVELLLRDGEGVDMRQARAQHRVLSRARERLLAAAIVAGFDSALARPVIYEEEA